MEVTVFWAESGYRWQHLVPDLRGGFHYFIILVVIISDIWACVYAFVYVYLRYMGMWKEGEMCGSMCAWVYCILVQWWNDDKENIVETKWMNVWHKNFQYEMIKGRRGDYYLCLSFFSSFFLFTFSSFLAKQESHDNPRRERRRCWCIEWILLGERRVKSAPKWIRPSCWQSEAYNVVSAFPLYCD